ncbi:hypothetical protein PX52LOC_06250 [Limnoglobus roseus]|uniref:Uncharacterized protein n=1 Tax=Limnoglobus roseus TaxID=2598579 RepID=A0A5C1AJZ4_9BACT|nr:hypothetical protein PX52LOC_06250 [Limnoglobus roseus]
MVACHSRAPSPPPDTSLPQPPATGDQQDTPRNNDKPKPAEYNETFTLHMGFDSASDDRVLLAGTYHDCTVHSSLTGQSLGLFLSLHSDGTYEVENRSECGMGCAKVNGTWEVKDQVITFTEIKEFGFLKGHFTRIHVLKHQGHTLLVREQARPMVDRDGVGPQSKYSCLRKSDAEYIFETKGDKVSE